MEHEAAATMADVGHLVIDESDRIVEADDGSASILSRPQAVVVGSPILDLMVEQDRETFAQCLRHLRSYGRPFRIAKRVLRRGEAMWVESTVGLSDIGEDGTRVVVTLVPIASPDRFDDPRQLLTFALGIRAARDERNALFDTGLFVDPAWDMMVACYIAESEGRALDVSALAGSSGTGTSVAQRWIKAMVSDELLEPENEGTHYRLSPKAYRRFERWLSHSLIKWSVRTDI